MLDNDHGLIGPCLRRTRFCWRRRLGKLADHRQGAIAIEFAFVLPVLLVLLLGIIQFGFAFFVQANMHNAAREAARELAVGAVTVAGNTDCTTTTYGTAEDVACDALVGLGGAHYGLVACDPDNAHALCAAGDDVGVRITVQRSVVALGDILGLFETGTIVAQVRMRKEDS